MQYNPREKKISELYTLKWGNFMICELCINKAAILKRKKEKIL